MSAASIVQAPCDGNGKSVASRGVAPRLLCSNAGHVRKPVPLVLTALAALAPAAARAQLTEFEDPYDVPSAPRPPTLPELTHSEIEGTSETTAGALIPTAGGVWTHAYVQRFNVEVPLALRRWYVGATYEVAAGGTANSFEAVGGNLSLDGRTLWATTTGLGFGGGMGLVLPTATYGPGSDGAVVALNAATLRPWDVTYFTPGIVALRPHVDVRALFGQFIAQFRQGLDVTVSPDQIGQRNLYATTGAATSATRLPRRSLRVSRRSRRTRSRSRRRTSARRTCTTASAPPSSCRRTSGSRCRGFSRRSACSRTSARRCSGRTRASGGSGSRSPWSTTRARR